MVNLAPSNRKYSKSPPQIVNYAQKPISHKFLNKLKALLTLAPTGNQIDKCLSIPRDTLISGNKRTKLISITQKLLYAYGLYGGLGTIQFSDLTD